MIRVLVNATALDSRGAFSIVKSFLYEMNSCSSQLKNKGIMLEVLVAKKELCDYANDIIKVIYVRYAKKSLFHKWKYERFMLPKYVKQNNFDAYLSLQNYVLKKIGIRQFTLIHQPIPFSDLHISEIEFINWLKYKILMKRILIRQKNDLNGVFVQTNWMKESVLKILNYSCPVLVLRPPVNDIRLCNKPLSYELNEILSNKLIKLFYPTNMERYKNNRRLVEAVDLFNATHDEKVILYITIKGVSSDSVKFIGNVPYDSIFTMYKRIDALIFPSLTETLGLPLLEARTAKVPVLSSDLPYSREICGNNAYYFDPRNVNSMIQAISNFLNSRNRYVLKDEKMIENPYMDYIEFIISEGKEQIN